MAGKSIALIGFMGAGKSAVGQALAEKLSVPLIDTDALIERRENMTISQIFERFGETGFRTCETAALRSLGDTACVLSCGGGLVLRQENADYLREHYMVVRLCASAETTLSRVGGGEGRPLLRGKSPEQVKELMIAREPFYSAAAEITINTDGRSVDDICADILTRTGRSV